MAKQNGKNANEFHSANRKKTQKTNHENKTKEKLKKALKASRDANNSVLLTPAKVKSVPLPSNLAKSTSSNRKSTKKDGNNKPNTSNAKFLLETTAKHTKRSTLKNGFVENDLVVGANCENAESQKAKRNIVGFIEEPINVTKLSAKKLKRKSSGFIETNLNNEDETKFVDGLLQEQKQKIIKAMGMDPTIPTEKFWVKTTEDVPTSSVIVHDGDLAAANITSSASDSEDDSYINKFFNGNDAKDDFNSNDALPIDEFEKLSKHNGFANSDSEASLSEADESIISENSDSSASAEDNTASASKKNHVLSDHKKQMVHFNGNGNRSDDNSDEYYDDSDVYDFGDYFNEMDGEYISDEDDFGEYTDSSDDEDDEDEEDEQAEEESDFYSHEGDSYDSNDYDDDSSDLEQYDSSYDGYGHSDSDRDEDESTYDEFMGGRYKDDSNDTDFYDSDYDDLVIAQGTAISYKFTDSRIKLFENDTKTRIIELPKSDSEDENCAELVSLNVTRKEILNNERHKRQTKKMHDDLIALKVKQLELEHQRKCKSYFKLDDETQATPSLTNENTNEDVKPVIITCLPGIIENISIDECFTNDSSSEASNDLINMEINSNVVNRSVITTVPLIVPLTSSMDIDDIEQPNSSDDGDVDKSEFNGDALMPIEGGFVEFSQSERIQNRNINLPKRQVAKTKPKFFNSINSQHVLLLLRNIIHFHGNLQVKLISGNAQVFGYQLECNKSVTVHSPRGHSLIYLMPTQPKRKSSNNITSFAALNELKIDFLAQDIDDLIAAFNHSTDAIILLERDTKHKGVNMIDRYMRETMFPNINAFNNESPYYSSEFILRCQFSFRPRNSLVINETWSTVALKNASKLVTIGGKGVGKSTFVRYTINSNINKFKKFVFIDLDIGQPELFVPQTISATLLTNPILGPGYLENIPPTKAIFFGEINVLLNPIKYLRCVIELYEFCSKCEAFQNVPWVINTMGYSRSLGSELMACILRIFQPTDVVQIQSESANENFEAIIDADYANAFKFNIFAEEMVDVRATCNFRTHLFNAIIGNDVNSNKSKQTDMNPKDIRYAMILSKLGNCLRCNSDWLTSIRPFEVSLNDLQIIVANGDKVDPASAADILNANLVYLCENKTANSNDVIDCHGIGIVRAIDTSTEKLYLLSSIPMEELTKVNVLAIGAIPLPSAVLLNQHGQVRGTVPFVYNSDGFVGSKQVAQHIFRSDKNRKNNPIELVEN